MLGAWDVVDMETVTFPKTLELVVYCFKTLLLLHQHKDPAPPDEEWEVTNKDPDMSEELKDHTVDLMFAALGTLAPHIPGMTLAHDAARTCLCSCQSCCSIAPSTVGADCF